MKTKLGFDLQEFKGFVESDIAAEPQAKTLPTARDLAVEIDIREKAALLSVIDLRLMLKKPGEVLDKWPTQLQQSMVSIQTALKHLAVAPPPNSPIEELRAHHIKVEVLPLSYC